MPFTCVAGGSVAARTAAVHERCAGATVLPATVSPADWPFVRQIVPDAPASRSPIAIRLTDLHLAFPGGQTPGTRLVLTQSTYQLQRYVDWLMSVPHVHVIADASLAGLQSAAPEAFAGRGPWSRIELIQLDGEPTGDDAERAWRADSSGPLRAAFAASDPVERVRVLARAVSEQPSNAALLLGLGSATMEVEDAPGAQRALDRALGLAGDWEAVWFEYGKLWLRADDLERAADRFAEAARLMPTFSAALSNLGAALAETDRATEAIAALEQALALDPSAHTILNNLAVVYREQGRLDEAVSASRRVLSLAPEFVFGHYNLGHALFLQGRFAESRNAYVEGQRRDTQKNPVQAARTAVARAAAGEHERAANEMAALAALLPESAREQVFGEAEATLEAVAGLPGSDRRGLARVLDVVRTALT